MVFSNVRLNFYVCRTPKDTSFLQGYGLTETSPVIAINFKGNKHFGSIGGPGSNTEMKIINTNEDTDFKGLGVNETGEVLVRGPQVMLGYLNNPKATAETFSPCGWYRTGDIGHYDENGFFYITDRLKELIKVKGFQVPPAELEELLRSHPMIVEAAVVGVSHPKSGEVPRAFVVKKEGATISEDELKDFIAAKVSPYKRLDGGVQFVESIPKNTTGKILRRLIKEQYC